jgi:hypothetical protein
MMWVGSFIVFEALSWLAGDIPAVGADAMLAERFRGTAGDVEAQNHELHVVLSSHNLNLDHTPSHHPL